ncbi:MAG: lytic transglycosylase domain-containing protein [Oligoflexales bacterium]
MLRRGAWIPLLWLSIHVSAKELPTPSGLSAAVDFWEKVFHTYTPRMCVVHDEKTHRILATFNIKSRSRRRQSREVKDYVTSIRKILNKKIAGHRLRTSFQRKVIERAKGLPLRQLRHRLRCQRGVDLSPSIQRSKRYLPVIHRVLEKNGLPKDLAYLPHLESGFNPRARSKAGALGIWQLMSSTVRQYNRKMKLRHRREVDASTDFAVKHLKRLYSKTKSWPLAVTAYNYGVNGTMRAIRRFGRDYMKIHRRHRTRVFRFAARNYYPSFLAVRNVVKKKQKKT